MTVVPRASRMNFLVRLIMPWRLPACAVLILPVAVTLNRFLQLDLVFILGISGSSFGRLNARLGMPHWPDAHRQARRIRHVLLFRKGGPLFLRQDTCPRPL